MTQPENSARLFRRLWTDYLREHRGGMLGAFLLMTVEGSTLALISWMLKPLFDRVFIGKEAGAIWWVGGAIFGIFLLRAVTLVASRSMLSRISGDFDQDADRPSGAYPDAGWKVFPR